MGDEWRSEADYDQDRLERHVHRAQRATVPWNAQGYLFGAVVEHPVTVA